MIRKENYIPVEKKILIIRFCRIRKKIEYI